MSGLFYNLGRKLGQVAVPVARRSKWLWTSLTGTEADSVRAETEMGRAMAAEMRAGLRERVDPRDSELVAEMCQRLSARLRNNLRTFRAEVAQTGSPTALALPGGFIFVDVALLDLCARQPDELAFVVGHEMAHVVCGHCIERLVARVGIDVVGSLLGRGALGPWMRQTGTKLLQTAYSRDNELEADELGARLAEAAGYDPAGAIHLLERFGRNRNALHPLNDYFTSHPPEHERIASLRRALERKPPS
jgi:beta-barrel assembly-enhancing protease